MSEHEIRSQMVSAGQRLGAEGLNRGASGDISVRYGDTMLITPTAVAFDDIGPEMLAQLSLVDDEGNWLGPKAPSSEWRFHRDILGARPDINAVIHTHAPCSTILAITRRPIPALHHMIVAFGGPNLRRALWLAGEREVLAHQHYRAPAIGGGHVLSDAQIEVAARGSERYGVQARGGAA